MKGQVTLFSKASDEWSTPQSLYDELHREFDFQIDCAATAENSKCPVWFGPGSKLATDALAVGWPAGYTCWLNPPYSQARAFVAKAALEIDRQVTTVMLLPARTDTRMFHEYIYNEKTHRPYRWAEIRFIKGRLTFGGATNSAPFPSMVVVFRP